jgi:RimJ/RimL family protein N-acetyltransferase
LNDPDVTRYLGSRFGLTETMEQKWFDGVCSDRSRVHWAIELGGRHIGAAGIEDIDWLTRTAVTGIMIGERDCWRKGIASMVMVRRAQYAFDELNLQALFTEIFVANEGSLRAAQKAGYREYGRRPFARYLDGAYQDAWLGVLPRSEWEQHREVL